MTWEAELKKAVPYPTHWKIQLEYDNGAGKTKTEGYRFTGADPAALKAFARNEALKFERKDSTFDFTTLIGQSIDVTPPVVVPPTPPTQAEIDEAAWFADWETLKAMNYVMATIPTLATQARIDAAAALEASLDAGWKNSYLEKI